MRVRSPAVLRRKTYAMKYFPFFFLLFISTVGRSQAITVGEPVPNFPLTVLSEKTETISSAAFAGKVILLDFWATWCSPCISSMPHLDDLQEAFPNQLRVVAVSEETEARLRRFVDQRGHQFLFARDTGYLRQLFPHSVIPHSVLIGPDGVVAAITSPEKITTEIIHEVLRGGDGGLPVKKQTLDFDPQYDYFQADTNTLASFVLQPHNPATPAFSKEYYQGPFQNRRLSIYNVTIPDLYRHAYGTTIFRSENEFDDGLVAWENTANQYCADIIVAHPDDLLPQLQAELEAALPIKARRERRTKRVVVLRALEEGTFNAPTALPVDRYAGRQDSFSSGGATTEDFRSYLEDFGIFGLPVVDETGIEGAYAIDFSYDPENPETFKSAMRELGLTYSWEERDVEVLVLYVEE